MFGAGKNAVSCAISEGVAASAFLHSRATVLSSPAGKTKHRKNGGENMSNGTKVILGLIMFALGMLIMVSAFCPPSCTVRLITR